MNIALIGHGTMGREVEQAARARVLAACKANKIFFLNSMSPANVVDMIKEGVIGNLREIHNWSNRPVWPQ